MSKFKLEVIGENKQVCPCGKHKGLGSSSPYQLAQIYAWFKDKKPSDSLMTPEKYNYLKSYEQAHGRIDTYIFGKERELKYS